MARKETEMDLVMKPLHLEKATRALQIERLTASD